MQLTETPVLRWTDDERLELRGENGFVAVAPKANFPWTRPREFLSLRDREGKELALVEDPSALDETSRAALERSLEASGFTLRVTAIVKSEEDGDLRVWEVRTENGPRIFQTKLDEWPRTLPDGRVLIPDVAGDLYEIRDAKALDAASRRILWALADAD
jgi:hypothetical protein